MLWTAVVCFVFIVWAMKLIDPRMSTRAIAIGSAIVSIMPLINVIFAGISAMFLAVYYLTRFLPGDRS